MNKEKYQETDLKKYYKHVLTCSTCSQKYGQDSIPLYKQCPFCTYQLTQPRVTKRSVKDEDIEV